MSSPMKPWLAAESRRERGTPGAPGALQGAPLRMGGIALKNGLVLLSERHWAAAVREKDGGICVASGRKPRLVAGGGDDGAGGSSGGVPLLRGLGRFGESLLVLAQVKIRLPQAELPLEGGRVAAALAGSLVATSAVKALAPKSALMQEAGSAVAAFVPAVLALKNSPISGYHGAEHKVIGGRESAFAARTAAGAGAPPPRSGSMDDRVAPSGIPAGAEPTSPGPLAAAPEGGAHSGVSAIAPAGTSAAATERSAAASKEHDRCGSNLVGPYLLATVATNLVARGRSGRKSPAASAVAGALSLGVALEALRWATKNGDSLLARLLLLPGRTIQRHLTTAEPSAEQLEVGERALAELLRLESASV